MARASLIDTDQAFLRRLDEPRKHPTFASYVYAEIRGQPWRRGQCVGIKSKPRQNSRYVYGWLSRPYAEAQMFCRALDRGPIRVNAGTLT
jgi:hypothetical protein